jgi:DNA-binding XRE family transcriptional regulator
MPRQNSPPASTPQAVIQQIEQLALNIVIARKRRRETQAQWAKRLGISQPTMARLERGDPSVAMATYVMCMWLIKPSVGLADLIAPQADDASLELEVRMALGRASAIAHAPKPKVKANTVSAQSISTAAGLAALMAKPAQAAP